MQWCINNTDNGCQHITTPNLETDICTYAGFIGWGIMDTIHPLRDLWHKSEIKHINLEEVNAIEIVV